VWVATIQIGVRWQASQPDLIERRAVLAAVQDASRRCAVAFGHP